MTLDLCINQTDETSLSAGPNRRMRCQARARWHGWYLFLLCMGAVASAAEPIIPSGVAVLKELPIEAGTITAVTT